MNPRSLFLTGLLLAAAIVPGRAGSFISDFNTGALPPGTHTNSNTTGGAFLELTGGVNDSGCLKLTKAVNSQNGSFILDDLDGGLPIYGFDATFKLRLGGGTSTPADGMAFCVAPDLTDTSISGELGFGSGLRVTWGVYTGSGATPPDPAIRLRVGGGGTPVAYKGYTVAGISTSGNDPSTWWTDVHIRVSPEGLFTMDYKGVTIFTNFPIPGYQDFANLGVPMRFGLCARTGGLNDNFWIDDLHITTYTTSSVGFRQQPFSQTAQQGDTVAFEAQVVNNTGVSYQWMSNNVAIPGATGTILTIRDVQPSFSGSKYTMVATGPNNTATSTEATLTVINLPVPATPQLSFDFNSGQPAGVTLVGSAIVDATGGVADSGCVKLVNPSGNAAMLVADPTPTAPLYGFTARFKLLVGGGTVPPADGFAFACASNIPDAPSGDFESGAGFLGTGLDVTFDIYDNDNLFGSTLQEGAQPAPSIDVRFGGQVLGTVHLPISFMESGVTDLGTPDYTDVIIQLNDDSTLNVVYHGALVFDRFPVPAFGSIGPATNSTGSRFAFAARTGGLNDNIWLDNFELSTVTAPGAIRITAQPATQTILVNHAVTFTLGVNDTTGVTYQWKRDGAAITGATDSSYSLPTVALTDSGAVFTVDATKAGVTVTSTAATLTVANLTQPASPNLTFTFDNGLVPPDTTLYASANGGGYISPNGGVNDSGVLHLTDNVNSQSGAFIISNLFNGAQVSAIAASWDARLGGGSGNAADGYSFNFADNLAQAAGSGENGTGNGIRVCFDIYGSLTDNPPAPNVKITYKGSLVASVQVPKAQLETGSGFRPVLLRVDSDGKLYMSYGERVFFNGLQLPNYTFLAKGQFGFYGRTGGENENQWIDNIRIQATQSSGPLAIAVEPSDASVVAGNTATFSVSLNNPNGATYQWSKNGTAIAGATQTSYTTPVTTLADNSALFSVRATSPSGTATSRNALLTVVAPITVVNPIITYDFNDGAQPPDTILNATATGGGYIANAGGVGNSGVLVLTDNVNDQHAAFIMPDFNTNMPVKAITAHFAIRVADGSGRPADGFSFVWAPSNSIPSNATWGQDGIGNWLIVGFDTYDNGGEAPSFNVWFQNNKIASKLVAYSDIGTGGYSTDPTLQYADVFIRVNENGTLDLQYHGNSIFNALPLPGYTALAGGEFAIGAQTGGENETHWVDNIMIATSVGYIQVPLGYSRSGNDLRLTWGEGFKLQSATSLSSPNWQDVPNATSPYLVPMTKSGEYFRLINTP